MTRVAASLAVLTALMLGSGCASPRNDWPAAPSPAIADGGPTSLGRLFEAEAALQPGSSGFHLIVTGREAFATRVALADLAERTLDLQYYSAADDLSARLILQRVADAARRGVRVRVLLDDIQPSSRRFAQRAAAAHPAVEVRLFNPFYWSGAWDPARLAELAFHGPQLNRRMHNKLWITDNAAAIVGSRNLGDAYFDALDAGNFSDVDLLAAGPIVRELSQAFDAYWNSATAVPIGNFAPRQPAVDGEPAREPLSGRAVCADKAWCRGLERDAGEGGAEAWRSRLGALTWAEARVVYDLPDEDKAEVPSGIEHGWIEDRPGGARTRSELLIVSPYLVLGEDGLRHGRHAAARRARGGADQLAVVDRFAVGPRGLCASALAAAQRRGAVRDAAACGLARRAAPLVAGHLVQPACQVVVQDRERAIVGSLNQDPRSRLHNTELWLTIDSAATATDGGPVRRSHRPAPCVPGHAVGRWPGPRMAHRGGRRGGAVHGRTGDQPMAQTAARRAGGPGSRTPAVERTSCCPASGCSAHRPSFNATQPSKGHIPCKTTSKNPSSPTVAALSP